VIVEIYKKKDALHPEKAEAKIVETQENKNAEALRKLEQTIKVCQELGMFSQVNLAQYRIREIRKEAMKECQIGPEQLGYSKITEEDMKVWEVWLPKKYLEYQFSDYSFDQIPLEVTKEIKTVRALKLFDTLAIMTPEKVKVDPILIGWFDGVAYLIARWGESLIPFNKIKELVKESQELERKGGPKIVLSGLLMLFALLSTIITPILMRPSPGSGELSWIQNLAMFLTTVSL